MAISAKVYTFISACLLNVRCYKTYCDQELLALLARDDKQAFTELYDRFWKKLFVIAFNRLKEKESSEDTVHDVFVSLWAGRSHLRIEQLENYLATAAKYSVLVKIKKREKEKNFQEASVPALVHDESGIERSMHYKRILEIIETEVEHLPEKCRLIFRYSRQDGMPVKQIAKELHISPKTVENQLGKALRQIRLAVRSVLSSFLFLFFL